MFTDSHAHLTSDSLYPEAEALLQRAKEANVGAIINICTNETTMLRGLQLSKQYPWVYNSAATTPHDVDKEGETFFPQVVKNAKDLVAIGETGLDYYYTHSTPENQKKYLRRYLQLALSLRLPVIIHCREAFADFFEIIDSDYPNAPGVLHCFTGTLKEAEGVLSRGWYLSLSGIATFKKSGELREAAKITPLDRLLIETDAPYLAPQSRRGQQNEPSFLPETAQVIAEAKKIELSELAKATTANAKRLFKL
jgi:TatD DNase family protein